MLESGVKIEGSEVIPPSPDSVGKQKKCELFLPIFIHLFGVQKLRKKN